MALKDTECNCDEYCKCSDSIPCGCEGMDKDPHCEWCCQHLTPEQETKWRQLVGDPVVGGVSSCCGAFVEQRVLQTYMSETVLHICRTCGKDCQRVAVPKEY
jgi:hypothetical protein